VPPTTVARSAGRVLLLDAEGRVLLFRGGDPAAPDAGTWWFTPGGGLDPGESWAEGAARELFEETGLRVGPADLGDPVHEERTQFSFAGQQIDQDQRFFLLRVDHHEVDTTGFGPLETASIVEHRWWSPGELRASRAMVYPPGLADLLERLGA
jgi:8-oxo-dGTP pyrophosphatase MutT (NUDIX family)